MTTSLIQSTGNRNTRHQFASLGVGGVCLASGKHEQQGEFLAMTKDSNACTSSSLAAASPKFGSAAPAVGRRVAAHRTRPVWGFIGHPMVEVVGDWEE